MGKISSFKDVLNSGNDSAREESIRELVSIMSLDEKIRQMSGDTGILRQLRMLPRYNLYTYDSGENKRLGIPPIKFTDGPHGITVGNSTSFPSSTCRGASWDVDLEERVGNAMGTEARAQGANYFGGVCINLIRHPGGGRAQESFGEDPYLMGTMAVGMIKGLQNHVMACAKHFACNNNEESRFYVDARVDDRTLREMYLPHFKKCVDAGVASFMSAYNKVNGHYCGHSSQLLKDILKKDWKFDGFVISDFGLGVRDGKLGANGGLDIEMPFTFRYGRKLKRLVKKGEVSEDVIDEAVTRILRLKARFHNVGNPEGYDRKQIACKEHAALAREVSEKGTVLLKNENSALPINLQDVKTLAVIGKLADVSNQGDKGSSQVRPPYAVTPLSAIRKKAGSSVKVLYESGSDLAAARKASKEADAVIVVVGLSSKDEGEYVPLIPPLVTIGGDRRNLNLREKDESLINAVTSENKRCIVVLEGGSAITVESWVDKVQALLMAWYPGMEGGNAIAGIIFGDVNPSGKLPMIFPKSTDQLPPFDPKAKSIDYDYYHGYRLLDRNGLEPRFHFGYGLSYTTYKYENLKLDKKEIGKNGSVKVEVDVTNTGKVQGEEVVQLYIGYKGSKVDRAVKDLKGFAKIALEPGENKTCIIEVRAEELAFYNVGSRSWEVEEIEYIVYVGPSSRSEDLGLSDTFTISG